MIDLHTHILPGIDDGSRSLEMTASILQEEKLQGVTLVVATPHFYAQRMSVHGFLERREQALEDTLRMQAQAGGIVPAIRTGAEVYYFRGMGDAGHLAELTIEGTGTILVEMPFEQWDEKVFKDIEGIINGQGLTVILAHIERYIEFQKDRRWWDKVLTLPVIPQINAGSFIKKGGLFHSDRKRRFCYSFIEDHPAFILGSDCHSLTGRPPNMGRARDEIIRQRGEGCFETAQKTAEEVLKA